MVYPALIHHQGHKGHEGEDVQDRTRGDSLPLVSSVLDQRSNVARLVEILREAAYGLYHHWFRAALSMLGISWGIISVVVLLAYGNGFRSALDAGFRGAFSDGTVVVWPGQ